MAGLSALADDEADLGAAVIDMGAGTTTIAVFAGGRFVHADGFALGGHHVTMDLARGLNARVADAERIKTLYGSVLSGGSDERDMIAVPPVDDDEREAPQFVSRANLVRIIKPRVEEILEMVRDRLAASPFSAEPRGRVVLTGGASQLTGLPDSPRRSSAVRCASAGRSASAGCPRQRRDRPLPSRRGCWSTRRWRISSISNRGERGTRQQDGGYIARVGRWLRESF